MRCQADVPGFHPRCSHESVCVRARHALVFPNDRGAQWNRHRFRDEVWQPAVEAAGYDSFPFHMLRHTAISLMCRAAIGPNGLPNALVTPMGVRFPEALPTPLSE